MMEKDPSAAQGRTLATVAYLTFIGTIVAFFLNEKKNEFVTFHIRQMFGLIIMLLIANISFGLHPTLGDVLWVITFAGWAYGLIGAILKKRLSIPFLGEKFQQWFQFIK